MPARMYSEQLKMCDTDFLSFHEHCTGYSLKDEFYTTPFPSEDIWKKFELPVTPPRSPKRHSDEPQSEFDEADRLWPVTVDTQCVESCNVHCVGHFSSISGCMKNISSLVKGLRHDCMWAGSCRSEEHIKRVHSDVECARTDMYCSGPDVRSTCKYSSTEALSSPDTPPSRSESEDEMDDCDTDESEFGTLGSLPEVSGRSEGCSAGTRTTLGDHSYYTISDHSYHSQRRPTKVDHLGVQTPSDSEEEIDVVSLGEKVQQGQKSSVSKSALDAHQKTSILVQRNSLPNNPNSPSAYEKRQLRFAVAAVAEASKQKHAPKKLKITKEVPVTVTYSDKDGKMRTLSVRPPRPDNRVSSAGVKRAVLSSPKGLHYCEQQTKRRRLDYVSPKKRGFRSGSDSENEGGKRSMHNTLERQRRVDLRNAFESLKGMIPDFANRDRVAKVMILKKSATYCQTLTIKERMLKHEQEQLRKRNEILQKKLSLLQRRR